MAGKSHAYMSPALVLVHERGHGIYILEKQFRGDKPLLAAEAPWAMLHDFDLSARMHSLSNERFYHWYRCCYPQKWRQQV